MTEDETVDSPLVEKRTRASQVTDIKILKFDYETVRGFFFQQEKYFTK